MTERFKKLVGMAATGESLASTDAAEAFELIVRGEATPVQIGAFLMALRVRGETISEITAAARAMRGEMLTVDAPPGAIDIVGTGGDSSGSYNVSTCAALIVAGTGVPVAKHGNRAISSRSGAADVLAELGVRIDLTPDLVAHCIRAAGIGFMFAPAHHPAMRHVAPIRIELGIRTIFNLLGPLVNPAGVRHHLVGVYAKQWVEPIAHALGELGSERALVVHGSDGLDELTLSGVTTVGSLADGVVRTFEITPEEAGLTRLPTGVVRGGAPVENAAALRAVLDGQPSPYREVAALNAAAALLVAGQVEDLRHGVQIAVEAIDSGRARARLYQLVAVSNQDQTLRLSPTSDGHRPAGGASVTGANPTHIR